MDRETKLDNAYMLVQQAAQLTASSYSPRIAAMYCAKDYMKVIDGLNQAAASLQDLLRDHMVFETDSIYEDND